MRALLGIGSNVGDRIGNLQAAVNFLDLRAGSVLAVSSVYETAPLYVEDQQSFYNAVLSIDTPLAPSGLLALSKSIEAEIGRIPRQRYGPREIDIDVLAAFDDTGELIRVNEDDIELPHPMNGERRFVLEPMNEIDPDALNAGGWDLASTKSQICNRLEGVKLSVHKD
jgi:2-amino-4-hydroxy-6-hydroxymethyldihydropteridine diphosphokinase